MGEFVSQFGMIIAVATAVVVGAVALYGLWDERARKRRHAVDGEEDRLIALLTTTVQELEKKVNHQGQEIERLSKKVNDLESENGILIEVLQGRDKQTQKFYEEAFKTMELSKDTHILVKSLHETNKDTNENIKKLIDVIGTQANKSQNYSGTKEK